MWWRRWPLNDQTNTRIDTRPQQKIKKKKKNEKALDRNVELCKNQKYIRHAAADEKDEPNQQKEIENKLDTF